MKRTVSFVVDVAVTVQITFPEETVAVAVTPPEKTAFALVSILMTTTPEPPLPPLC